MKVLLANPRGFCAGVDRAIDIVERAIELFGRPIYVRHEVVHNTHVVDRLRISHVVDFILAHWDNAYFPAFNVADSAITIGAAFLLFDAWRESRGAKRASA